MDWLGKVDSEGVDVGGTFPLHRSIVFIVEEGVPGGCVYNGALVNTEGWGSSSQAGCLAGMNTPSLSHASIHFLFISVAPPHSPVKATPTSRIQKG